MSTRTNLIVDAGIFAAFLTAMQPRLTGISLHEWLSLGLAAAVIAHLLLHWKWITSVLVRFFKNLFYTSRLKFMVDAALFTAFTAMMMSGIMISRSVLPALGIQLAENHAWRGIHSASANLSLLLVALHFALNWKWVVGAIKRYVFQPAAGLLGSSRTPAAVPVKINDSVRADRS